MYPVGIQDVAIWHQIASVFDITVRARRQEMSQIKAKIEEFLHDETLCRTRHG